MEFDETDEMGSTFCWSMTDVVVKPPKAGDINSMPYTEAAGLPRGFAGDAWRAVIARSTVGNEWDLSAFAMQAENPEVDFADRYAAGSILGLVKDPRVNAKAPLMLDVPAGRYEIGTNDDKIAEIVLRYAALGVKQCWISKEAPRHSVELAAFRIAAYPVTNAEYSEFLRRHPDEAVPSSWHFGTMAPGQGNHPVFTIEPEAADRYVRWLSSETGVAYRLPTEAEWEVAAGGGQREFPWGNEFLADKANTLESGLLWTTPIGIFPNGRSQFGCFDMAGNVEEFVSCTFSAYPGAQVEDDDLAMINPSYRIARGGSFSRYQDLARCTRRHGFISGPLYAIGFRLAADGINIGEMA